MTEFNLTPITPKNDIVDLKTWEKLHAAMTDTVVNGRKFMSEYPPQTLTKTGYRRTGTLKRSWWWDVVTSQDTIEGRVSSNANMAPYNIYVEGEEQRNLFRGAGWQNIQDLMVRMQAELVGRVQRVLK